MIKLTQTTLDKLTELLLLAGFTIRHEKGNFKSGSCMIESGKLIVLNKFSPVESRVTFLIDVLKKIKIDDSLLDDKRKSFLKEALKFQADGNDQATISAATDGSDSPSEINVVNS